ncbi:MAG: hypothetical protein J6N93_08860 [Clostridia bacterium]|nr:hypothetical protein [Clostridia bacterium]
MIYIKALLKCEVFRISTALFNYRFEIYFRFLALPTRSIFPDATISAKSLVAVAGATPSRFSTSFLSAI